jgi:hypothetical protein
MKNTPEYMRKYRKEAEPAKRYAKSEKARARTLRCEATLRMLDGTLIGGCEFRSEAGKRLKWHWWYDKDALISHTEPTRQELAFVTLKENGQ